VEGLKSGNADTATTNPEKCSIVALDFRNI